MSVGRDSKTVAPPGARKRFGQYALDERIAIGGAAEVFLARPWSGAEPAEQLVIKRLLPSLRHDPMAQKMFEEEAALQRRFHHANIVRCYEAGRVDGEPYLAIEYVHGADLQRVLRAAHARKHPLGTGLACHIGREVLKALGTIHSERSADGRPLGLMHRDVTPSNIYLSNGGETKLGDFGIATPGGMRTPRPGTLGASLAGKFAYLAPEQVATESVDHRADLFSLATVLAEMLLNRPLFPGAGQLAVLLAIRDARIDTLDDSTLPAPLLAILRKALARQPDARYAHGQALAEALRPFALPPDDGQREVAKLVRYTLTPSMELRAAAPADSSIPPTVRRSSPARELLFPPDDEPKGDDRPSAQTIEVELEMIEEEEAPEHKPHPALRSSAVTVRFEPPPSRVRTTQGTILGPLTYAQLIELVATGRIGADDEVDFMGLGFARLVTVEELARHLAPRSTVTQQLERPGVPDWQGVLGPNDYEAGIVRALVYIATKRASGVLIAEGPRRRKEIYFVRGRLYFVSASDKEKSELIGEYLVARSLIDRADLDMALAVLPRFGGRLGEALTTLGLIEPVTLFRALGEQGRDRVVEVFGWPDGRLSFFPDQQAGKVDFPLDVPVGPIIEGGIMALFDTVEGTSLYSDWFDRRIQTQEIPLSLREAGWSNRVERALVYAQTPISVRALMKALSLDGLSPHDALRAIESARAAHLLDFHPDQEAH